MTIGQASVRIILYTWVVENYYGRRIATIEYVTILQCCGGISANLDVWSCDSEVLSQ